MGLGLALPLLASLATAASAQVELGARAEGRTSTLDVAGLSPETRAALSLAPRAAVIIDTRLLRATGTYAPRFWTSDVGRRTSPLTTHEGEMRIATRQDAAWNATAAISAVRGRTDPLADPLGARTATGPAQDGGPEPIAYETVRASLRGDVALVLRTRISMAAGGSAVRAIDRDERAQLPTQRGASLELSAAHLVSERDTVRVSGMGRSTSTWRADGRAESGIASASATWRRRLSRSSSAWAGAGAALVDEDEPSSASVREVLGIGEAGFAREVDGRRVAVEVAARLVPFVDRFSGEVNPMVDVSSTLQWRATARVALRATAAGGLRTDGDTALAGLDARAAWMARERLGIEVGVVGRWQRERRSDLPSFAEGGVVVAFVYETGPLDPALGHRANTPSYPRTACR